MEATTTPASGASPYRSLRRPAWVAIGLLAVGIVVDAVVFGVEIGYYDVLSKLDQGIDLPVAEVSAADDRSAIAAFVQFASYIPAIIAFIVWFSRAYRNLERLGVTGLRYRPGWSIGAWFVPILALFRPKQIANDIWRASGPRDVANWHDTKVPYRMHWWWGMWIVGSLVGNISARIYLDAETLPEQLRASAFSAIADLYYIVAAVLAIIVIRSITVRQEARAQAPRPIAPHADVQGPHTLQSA